MDTFLKRLTPVVLIALGLGVWFETTLFDHALFVHEVGLLRFVLGIICIYTAILVIERHRMEARLTHVLGSFKQFYAERAGAREPVEGKKGLEAVSILTAALGSEDAVVRENALGNLKRLTGKDFGPDPAGWLQWLAATRSAADSAVDSVAESAVDLDSD